MTEPLPPGAVCPRTPEDIFAQKKDVRMATLADLPACAAIINDYIDATDWLPRSAPREEIAAVFSGQLLERRRVFVADEGMGVVGYASFDEEAGVLPVLYLAPAARGRGLGKALLDAIKALGAFDLTVWEANPAARRFYEREGLCLTGEGVDDDGLSVWRMRWAP